MTPHQDRVTVDGHHVATLVMLGGDFPWAHGTYTPGPHAAVVAAAFVDLPDGRRELDVDRVTAAGLGPPVLDDATYLHTLVVRDDGSAAWRSGFDPLD